MTSAAGSTTAPQADVRTIVGGGIIVGVVTAVGVAIFALASRGMAGTTEAIFQSILVLAGGAVFSYLPSMLYPPRDADSIAWTAMIGLLGSLAFTVIDTIVFRPLNLYHWTWDAIGGGSGFWYIPVWWMGSAFLAWLGAWVVANRSTSEPAHVPSTAGVTAGIAIAVAAILVLTGIVPFHAAGVALAYSIGLILHVAMSVAMKKG